MALEKKLGFYEVTLIIQGKHSQKIKPQKAVVFSHSADTNLIHLL